MKPEILERSKRVVLNFEGIDEDFSQRFFTIDEACLWPLLSPPTCRGKIRDSELGHVVSDSKDIGVWLWVLGVLGFKRILDYEISD
jgi:hypothetical protein